MNLREKYEEMMSSFDEIKSEVKEKDSRLYERWKAYGFQLDGQFVSMGPNLADIVDDFEQDIDFSNVEDERVEMAFCLASELFIEPVVIFVKDALDLEYEPFYYRGKNNYYGPAIYMNVVDLKEISHFGDMNICQFDDRFIVYPKEGLPYDIESSEENAVSTQKN